VEEFLLKNGKEFGSLHEYSEIVKYIREQRHDFMNHIQVIWGYLQLDKPDQAMRYIGELNSKLGVLGALFRLEDPVLSLFLYNHIKEAFKMGVNVDIETDVEHMSGDFGKNYLEKLFNMGQLLQEIIKRTAGLEDKTVYIDIFCDDNIFYIVFSNNPYDDNEELIEGAAASLDTDIKNAVSLLIDMGLKVYCKAQGDKLTIKAGFSYQEI